MDRFDRLPLLLDPIPDLRRAGMPAGERPELWCPAHPEPAVRLLAQSPGAGAGTLCAPTLCANRFCLPGEDIPALNQKLVALARRAAGRTPVGALVGPSGLFVPPLGEADFDDIYEGYREQIRALDEAGADFLVLEGHSALSDLRAGLLAARTTGLPVLALLSADRTGRTLTGLRLLPALITLQAMGAGAVGLCCPAAPETAREVEGAVPHAAVPLAVRLEEDAAPDALAGAAAPFLSAGARILGGGIHSSGPEYTRALRGALQKAGSPAPPEEPDCEAAAIEREAFFLGDDVSFSEPIACTTSLGDNLIDLEDEQVSAALVLVTSADDALLLGRESGLTKLPIAVRASSPVVLDAALRYFQGRLIVDSASPLDRETLEPLAAKYGALIY